MTEPIESFFKTTDFKNSEFGLVKNALAIARAPAGVGARAPMERERNPEKRGGTKCRNAHMLKLHEIGILFLKALEF